MRIASVLVLLLLVTGCFMGPVVDSAPVEQEPAAALETTPPPADDPAPSFIPLDPFSEEARIRRVCGYPDDPSQTDAIGTVLGMFLASALDIVIDWRQSGLSIETVYNRNRILCDRPGEHPDCLSCRNSIADYVYD